MVLVVTEKFARQVSRSTRKISTMLCSIALTLASKRTGTLGIVLTKGNHKVLPADCLIGGDCG